MLKKVSRSRSEFKKSDLLKRIVFLLLMGVMIQPQSLFADVPKPGDVITSANVDQYTEFLPGYMARWVKDGWDMEQPATIRVGENTGYIINPDYIAASRNNMNVTLTPEGALNGYSGTGFPFPEPKEPNKALKIMWNQFYRPGGDEITCVNYRDHSKRKGGKIITQQNIYRYLKHSGRISVDPKPKISPNSKLYWSTIAKFGDPPAKDMEILSWRYSDIEKDDEMWGYIPTLRRSIRMVSSERSNPINGLPTSWDDLNGFDGKISKFDYKILGEQKVLTVLNQTKRLSDFKDAKYDYPIAQGDAADFEVVDCYLIEIKSKDPRYPESKKIAWVMKSAYGIPYCATYDKAGDLWKGFFGSFGPVVTKDGRTETTVIMNGCCSFKTEFWYLAVMDELRVNYGELSPSMFVPGILGTSF